jgi:L-ascorbate metabolism protein UlaG (beta-lactamase superfamily)
MAIHLTSLDNGTFCLNIGSADCAEAKTIVINPTPSNSGAWQQVEKTPIHYVLVTHVYEGIEEVFALLQANPSATLVAQVPVVSYLQSKAQGLTINALTMDIGNELDFPWSGVPASDTIGSLVMTANNAYGELSLTIPGSTDTYDANGFIVNAEGHQIYYSGVCTFNPELRSIGLTYKPDVAILSFSKDLGYETAEEISRAVMWLGSDIVLPIDASPAEKPSYEEGEIYSSIDIYTAAICRALSGGQSYVLEPTASSGRSSGPETRY